MVIREIMKMDAAEPFNLPVNPVALGIPDYFDVIQHPMDFGTICNNLEHCNKYMNSEDVFNDVQYIWGNCYKDKVFEEQKVLYPTSTSFSSDLRRNIENLEKNDVTSFRTLVNFGSEVYLQADVQIDGYTHRIASIKAQIKMVCEGIGELLQFPAK
ncbi:hypothetical protein GIB67_035645 [Kingdonia uniflora]|uniref:Bromo domain-containing protein n=1 Tax=Kingdonia uniflora TaxID=39325 RepID=A0A7J7KUR5_9MAGN|nr:hypothetical protein GIB67_035645 [Kingdonia uniflora]